jgi:hypothetical protein
MRAVIAPHLTDLTRYTGNGPEHQRSDEATLSIIGQAIDLLQIVEITYAGYRITLDHEQRRAAHQHHHDPAIPFSLDNDSVLQVFLYGLKPDPGVMTVTLGMKNGQHLSLAGQLHLQRTDTFTTRMSGVDDWTLIVDTRIPLDLITQSKIGTRENEARRLLSPGRHEVEVRAEFAERYALCLSPADDPYGSIEVKHSFIGEVGASSGRFLWSRNKLWLPPTRTLPAYVSLIVDCVTTPLNQTAIDEMKTADEVEVITCPEHAEHVRNFLSSYPCLRSKLTIASPGFNDDTADIAIIDPKDEVPKRWSGKVSCLLFDDQRDEEFRSRLESTLSRVRRDPRLAGKALESLWTTAESNGQPDGRSAAYGISWTTSSQSEQKGRVSLLRMMVTQSDEVKAAVHRYAAQPFNADAFKAPLEDG